MKVLSFLIFIVPLISFGETPQTRYWDQIEGSGNKKKLETVLTKAVDKEHFKKLNREEKIVALTYMSLVHLRKENYYQSLKLLTKAKALNTKNSDSLSRRYNGGYAILFREIGAYVLSVEYYKKCYDFESTTSGKYYIISEIGATYLLMNDFENAKKSFKKQIDLANELKNPTQIASAQNNLGYAYYKSRNLREAKKCYQQSLSVLNQSYTPGNLGHPKNEFIYVVFENLGATCYELNEYQLAVEYLSLAFEQKKSFSLTDPNCDIYGEVCLVTSLIKTGRQNEAEAIIQQFETHSSEMEPLRKLEFLDMKIQLCLSKKENDKLDQLLRERAITEQTLLDDRGIRLSATSNLVAQFMVHNHTRELKLEKVRREAEKRKTAFITVLWMVSSLLFIILLVFARQVSKNRQRKYKLEQELKAVEEERLQLKIKTQENSLTDLAIEVLQKQESAEELVKKMSHLLREEGENIKSELNSILREVKLTKQRSSNIQHEEADAVLHLKEFQQRLRTIAPNLSKTEIELITFIRMDLSNKDIATAKNHSENSVKTSKNRLKKKLGLQTEDNLTKFIQEI